MSSTPADLWSNPAFQTLMSTLWAAPLGILAIVLGIAGFVGWQGYNEIKEKILAELTSRIEQFRNDFASEQKQLIAQVQYQASLSTARSQIDLAWQAWNLAVDLVQLDLVKEIGDQSLADGAVLEAAKKKAAEQIDTDLPPKFFITTRGALAHVRFAKNASDRALFYLGRIPDEAQVKLEDESKKYLELEASQAYAYHVATDYRDSSTDEWTQALIASQRALAELDSDWFIHREDSEATAVAWIDTYLYVRIVYLLTKNKDHPKEAEQEFLKASEVYRDRVANRAALIEVKRRFARYLERPESFLRSMSD